MSDEFRRPTGVAAAMARAVRLDPERHAGSPTGKLGQILGQLFSGEVQSLFLSYKRDRADRARLDISIDVPYDLSIEDLQANLQRISGAPCNQSPALYGRRRLLKLEEEA